MTSLCVHSECRGRLGDIKHQIKAVLILIYPFLKSLLPTQLAGFLAQYSLASDSVLQMRGWDSDSSKSDEMSRTWVIYVCARSGGPISMNQYRATFCNCSKNFYTALAFDFDIFSIVSLEVSLLVFWKATQVCF